MNTCTPIILLILTLNAANGEQATRDQIGTVHGKPVYRDQIAAEKDLVEELCRIFSISEITDRYREEHHANVTPTEDEIEAAKVFYDKKHVERIKDREPELRRRLVEIANELRVVGIGKDDEKRLKRERVVIELNLVAPGRSIALFMLTSWKFQKHLYENYGGGRLLWQQGGIEAYDAHRKWLERLEKAGEFTISDCELRKKFYKYWTSQDGSAFLTEDEKVIQEFLNPEWQRN